MGRNNSYCWLVSGLIAGGIGLAVPLQGQAAESAAPPGLSLSPDALQQLDQRRPPASGQGSSSGVTGAYLAPAISDLGDGLGQGQVFSPNGIFTGQLRRSSNPFNPEARYWVFDQGNFVGNDGSEYSGRFYFFHEDWGDHGYYQDDWIIAQDGRYLLAGSRKSPAGSVTSGIYASDVTPTGLSDFTPADQGYLDWVESRYSGQVQALKQRQAAQEASGLSFGQVLALGLGAAALSQANIPSADAAQIGGAFAADVLSGGKANALNRMSADANGIRASAAASGGAQGSAPKASYTQEQVSVSCPSGVSSSIPISYRTRSCRDAMVDYAKVYSCNLIDDFSRVARQCKSACGDSQCRE